MPRRAQPHQHDAEHGDADETMVAESAPHVRKDVTRNRARLLDAANVVFARRGADATLNDIAKEAGLGNATVYRHFADKQEILDALFDDRVALVLGIFQHAESIDDAREALEYLLAELAALQSDDRGVRQALGVDATDESSSRVSGKLRPIAVRIVERAQAAGVVRPEFDASDIPLILRMIGAISDYADATAPELWRRYLNFVLDGIAAGEHRQRETVVAAPPLELAQRSIPDWNRRGRRQ